MKPSETNTINLLLTRGINGIVEKEFVPAVVRTLPTSVFPEDWGELEGE
jgi:hypothetical protein